MTLPGPPGGGGGGGGEEPPPPPPPPVAEPGPPATTWTTYAGDASRRSESGDATIAPPFGVLWQADLGGTPSYPLVADGRVFVVRSAGLEPNEGTVVEALDARTGARLWSVPIAGYHFTSEIAYGGGRVFVHDTDETLRALDAATGSEVWKATIEGSYPASPVVVGDTLYLQHQQITAIDTASGATRWRTDAKSTNGDPSVAGDRIFVEGACSTAALDRRDGRELWRVRPDCSGGGGGTPLLWRDRMMSEEHGARRAADGEPAGGPRVHTTSGDVGLELRYGSVGSEHRVVAHDLAAGRELWSAPNAAGHIGLPGLFLSVDEVNPEGPSDDGEKIVARDAATGAERWSGRLVAPPDRAIRQSYGGPRPHPAAGEGIVVIPFGTRLVALAPASRATPEPVTVALNRRPDLRAGGYLRVKGTTGALLAAAESRLEADVHPFGRFRTVKRAPTKEDGTYEHVFRADRNARLRVVTGDGRTSELVRVYAYPKLILAVRQAGGLVRTRLRWDTGRRVRARGRRVALYLGRRGSRRLVRLDAARLGGRRGRWRATFTFRPLPRTRANRRAYLLPCVAGAHRLGFGRADAVSRRCGRAAIRF